MKYEVIRNTSNSCVGAKGFAITKNKQIIPGWFETKSPAQQYLSTLTADSHQEPVDEMISCLEQLHREELRLAFEQGYIAAHIDRKIEPYSTWNVNARVWWLKLLDELNIKQ